MHRGSVVSAAPETDADRGYDEAMDKLRELTADLWWELDKIVGRRLCEYQDKVLNSLYIAIDEDGGGQHRAIHTANAAEVEVQECQHLYFAGFADLESTSDAMAAAIKDVARAVLERDLGTTDPERLPEAAMARLWSVAS